MEDKDNIKVEDSIEVYKVEGRQNQQGRDNQSKEKRRGSGSDRKEYDMTKGKAVTDNSRV